MFDRERALSLFHENRKRSAELFSIPSADDYYARPISLRNPIVFYEGHLPAFNLNTLWKRALGRAGVDAHLETLFARGIDPDHEPGDANAAWPTPHAVRDFVAAADERVLDALTSESLDIAGHPHLHGAEAVWTILEHEMMHHETLLYMFHRLPLETKNRLDALSSPSSNALRYDTVRVPRGAATLGAPRSQYGWDNEYDEHVVDVAEFDVDRYPVTNEQFLDFVRDRGYERSELWSDRAWSSLQRRGAKHPLFWESHDGDWKWRGMFELLPLSPTAPVYITFDEASAYAAWRGRRLMSEAEFHRAAYGSPDGAERAHSWGNDEPVAAVHGNFGLQRWDPVPVDAHPRGDSAWGIADLIGNGWEWTSSTFAPFDGFRPMNTYPEYSADFFDGQHFVLKGASPATHAQLVRRSFRNWFRPDYPYVYAKFRTVKS